MCVCVYACAYIYVYRYPTMTDVCKAALLPTKPSSDDVSSFRLGFRVKVSLPLTQSAPLKFFSKEAVNSKMKTFLI